MLALFEIPRSLLPEVLDCAAEFGVSEPSLLGAAIPVLGMAGDQQAALIGRACFQPGMVKSTYGTGCFMIQNTGEQPVTSKNRLLTTVGYRLDGKVSYAVEGSIFVAGAAVQWLRDGIKLIDHAHEAKPWRSRPATPTASTWCRPLPASARPTGTRRRAARSSA